MSDDAFTIVPMNRADVDTAVDWAAGEGWNPGLDDADCFYATDPNGFLIGRLDGEPVASISVVGRKRRQKYQNSLGLSAPVVFPRLEEKPGAAGVRSSNSSRNRSVSSNSTRWMRAPIPGEA